MIDVPQKSKARNPFWFKLINLAFLLPCIVWPFVLFTTIFFFDNPKSFFLTVILFIAINAYPLYLIGFLMLNSRLFRKNRLVATALPITFGFVFIIVSIHFLGGTENIKFLWTQISSKQNIENDPDPDPNQLCCGFTKDSLSIYYNDTLLSGADLNSFVIINFNWAKDNRTVYFNGKAISYIDSKTFRYLDYHYSIDKKNVFYDEQIIEGADAGTFKHIEGTQDGEDKNYCYRYGEKVDCKTLLTDEE